MAEVPKASVAAGSMTVGVAQRRGPTIPKKNAGSTSMLIDRIDLHALRKAVSYVRNAGEYLCVSHQQLGDAGASKLADVIEANKGLRELRVESAGIGDAGCIRLAKVAEMCSSSLELLSLAGNKIGDEGAKGLALVLARVGRNSNAKLREVCLDHNIIGNEGAVCLAVGVEMSSSLARLSLVGNAIGHAGVARLALAREKNLSLQEVCLDDAVSVRSEDWEIPSDRNEDFSPAPSSDDPAPSSGDLHDDSDVPCDDHDLPSDDALPWRMSDVESEADSVDTWQV